MTGSIRWRIFQFLLTTTLLLNLYTYNYPLLHNCSFNSSAALKLLAFGDPQITGASAATSLRKKLDIKGNDLFLRHTASTLRRHTVPDAVLVLGDLISSQWIDDAEFERRADRFLEIFPVKNCPVFNLTGNHDIGYHGEMTSGRVDRYLRRYGAVNYVVEFRDDLRLVAINALAIDGPPIDEYYHQVHSFIDSLSGFNGTTILLSHVPLYKPAGICRDGPMFKYYDNGGGIRAQNHLTYDSSRLLLEKVFSGHPGIILAGHDHEGCYASYSGGESGFEVVKGLEGEIPEVTVRSVMGEFGGNGGLVSVLPGPQGYEFEFQLCRFQVQHLWWVTEIVSYVTVFVGCLYCVGFVRDARERVRREQVK